MSNDALRAVALSEANKTLGAKADQSSVLTTAKAYLAFLAGSDASAKTTTAAGAEPDKKAESKPSANTAGATKPAADPKKVAAAKAAKEAKEEAAAKAALEAAEAEEAAGEPEADEPTQTEPLEADEAGVALAVKLMIEGGKRDNAIALLKKYKAASVTSMQNKDEATVQNFIDEVNELLGLNGEPSVD